jgi:C-terminal processing protease CtpA/Prc
LSRSPSRLGTLAVGLLVGAAVAVALLAFVGPLQDLLPESGEQSRAAEAQQVIEDSYFRPTDSEDLQNASIEGMVKRISKENDDKFSHYIDHATFKKFESST